MIAGKACKDQNPSFTQVFDRHSETEVLASVFPEIKKMPCVIKSPLRQDRHPSFSLYMTSSRHVRFKDFATGEGGSLVDLLCRYWECDFRQTLKNVWNLYTSGDVKVRTGKIITLTREEKSTLTSIEVVVRPWRDYDFEYWKSYGISRKWLKYAEVYPISYKIVTKREGDNDDGKKYIFPADKYAYCFVERKEGILSLKIYQPFNKEGYKWCSRMDRSVISLWTKVPETGDKIVICSSLKDALCVSANLEVPTIALQGEGYGMSDTAVNELKRRFKKVYVSFDTDKAGIEDGKKLCEKTGFINVIPNLGKCKDYSDTYKHYGKEQFIKNLKNLFN